MNFKKIKAEIPESVTVEEKSNILNACNPGDIFFGLRSRYLREKYYDNYFKYVVSVHIVCVCVYIYNSK